MKDWFVYATLAMTEKQSFYVMFKDAGIAGKSLAAGFTGLGIMVKPLLLASLV